MKQLSWFAALALAACGGSSGLGDDEQPMPDASVPDPDAPEETVVSVPAGDITGDTHWVASKEYILEGYVFVTGGTLTIDAGTVIKGKNGSALTITKDATLNAVGTAQKPIVFTSFSATPKAGDWGGVVMLGKAPINISGGTNAVEGFATSYGERVRYGGSAAAHDCGKLSYARIEYAGFELAPNNELNGLTVGGCGTATLIDYVQVHLGLDDGVEVFGGTVNLKHLVITQPDDDGFDYTFGWTGAAQFVVVQQKDGLGDKAIEADNHETAFDSLPRTAPRLWNFTLIGGDTTTKAQGGAHLRRGVAGEINNSIIAYFSKFAVDVDGVPSTNELNGGTLKIKNTYFVKAAPATAVWPANFDANASGVQNDCPTTDTCLDEATAIGGDSTNHVDQDIKLGDPKNLTAPNWMPAADSPVKTCPAPTGAGVDPSATYCGAFNATNWAAGWTRY